MYVQGVKMTELRPSEGRADKIGETVTVIGQGFTRVGELSCWFGDQHGTRAKYVSSSIVICMHGVQPAVFTSSTKITCMAPERGEGTVRVGVTNNGVEQARLTR